MNSHKNEHRKAFYGYPLAHQVLPQGDNLAYGKGKAFLHLKFPCGGENATAELSLLNDTLERCLPRV